VLPASIKLSKFKARPTENARLEIWTTPAVGDSPRRTEFNLSFQAKSNDITVHTIGLELKQLPEPTQSQLSPTQKEPT
jgi:hypothetical protein